MTRQRPVFAPNYCFACRLIVFIVFVSGATGAIVAQDTYNLNILSLMDVSPELSKPLFFWDESNLDSADLTLTRHIPSLGNEYSLGDPNESSESARVRARLSLTGVPPFNPTTASLTVRGFWTPLLQPIADRLMIGTHFVPLTFNSPANGSPNLETVVTDITRYVTEDEIDFVVEYFDGDTTNHMDNYRSGVPAPRPLRLTEFLLTTIPSSGDFDADGDWDIDDINELLGQGDLTLGVVPADPKFDLTFDGVLDHADVEAWLAEAGPANGFGGPFRPGDNDLDGTVSAIDLNDFAINWQGSGKVWNHGDYDGDGKVLAADLSMLALNWRSTTPRTGTPFVPESNSVVLFLASFLLIDFRRFVSRR